MSNQLGFAVNVDILNPGQFFACCGLLELAHRLWPGIEGHFEARGSQASFIVQAPTSDGLKCLLDHLCRCDISGLTEEEQQERRQLEERKRQNRLSDTEEERRKELGRQAREGKLYLKDPFHLTLDWWQTESEDVSPKTWAGRQEIHKIARAAQKALCEALRNNLNLFNLLDYGCVLRTPSEYAQETRGTAKPVEPFCFDARRYVHALKVGFSLDLQDAEIVAYPAVELLALIGLQRFRPVPSSERWSLEYTAWFQPLSAVVAAAVVSGAIPLAQSKKYRFRLMFRDDQKRYKAFGRALKIYSIQ